MRMNADKESRKKKTILEKGRFALYAKLIEQKGEDHQRGVAVGELGELVNALSKHLRGCGVNMRTCEEIADVEICLEQLKMMHDPENVRVPLFKRFKLARLGEFNVKGGEA